MKTHSKRFTDAVTKLYTAFHFGELNANQCTSCAVGTLCDGNERWMLLVKNHGSGILRDHSSPGFKDGLNSISGTGYSPQEIVTIEKIFLDATGLNEDLNSWHIDDYVDKYKGTDEQNFKGLCAVVEYLCELDGIPNIMDYTALFETENDAPKHQLEEVFV